MCVCVQYMSVKNMLCLQAGGTRLGTIIEIGAAFLTAHIIAFQANWVLTLLLLGVLPVFMLVLWLQTKVSMWAITVRRNAFLEANEV